MQMKLGNCEGRREFMGEKAVESALSHDCPSPERELVQTRKVFSQSVLF